MTDDNKSRRNLLRGMFAVGAATTLAGCGSDDTTDTETDTEPSTDSSPTETDESTPAPTDESTGNIDETRSELEQYDSAVTAWEDGWRNTMEYVANEDDSAAMGVPFTNPDVAEDEVDPLRPHGLFYQITDEGRYELLGAEWTVPAEAVDEAPTLFGETFSGPEQGLRARQPEQYALRAWLWADNPEGMFATFNPEITPPEYAEAYTDVGYSTRTFTNLETARQAGFNRRGDCRSGNGGSEGLNFFSEEDPFNEAGMVYHSYFQALLYEDTDDGTELVGVKWVMPVDEVDSRPSLVSQSMKGPIEGYLDGMPSHYQLTLWRKPNPNGLFARWNPTIEC